MQGIKKINFKNQKIFDQNEEKKNVKSGFTEKPSSKLTNIKCSDPFAPNKKVYIFKSSNSFAYVYNAGGIPCKIDHGSIKNNIKWNMGVDVSDLAFDPILITCFDGLLEDKHPYNFIARAVIRDMLDCPDAADKCIPIVQKIVWPLRTALSSKNLKVYEASIDSLSQLSEVVQDCLNPHLKVLIVPLMKNLNSKDHKLKEKIVSVFRQLESNGGPDAQKILKQLCPTMSGV